MRKDQQKHKERNIIIASIIGVLLFALLVFFQAQNVGKVVQAPGEGVPEEEFQPLQPGEIGIPAILSNSGGRNIAHQGEPFIAPVLINPGNNQIISFIFSIMYNDSQLELVTPCEELEDIARQNFINDAEEIVGEASAQCVPGEIQISAHVTCDDNWQCPAVLTGNDLFALAGPVFVANAPGTYTLQVENVRLTPATDPSNPVEVELLDFTTVVEPFSIVPEDTCYVDAHCGIGSFCNDAGSCQQQECINDQQCGENAVCERYTCQPVPPAQIACTTNLDCPRDSSDFYRCIDDVCRQIEAECTPDHPCSEGFTCSDGWECIPLDTDEDGIDDPSDNCPSIVNPLQEDQNANNVGDLCEGIIAEDIDPLQTRFVSHASIDHPFWIATTLYDAEDTILAFKRERIPSLDAETEYISTLSYIDQSQIARKVVVVYDVPDPSQWTVYLVEEFEQQYQEVGLPVE